MPDADLLSRIAELEVAAARRLQDAEILFSRIERIEEVNRRMIDGAQPLADARKDITRRKRVLAAQIALASGLGLTYRAAKRVENVLAGNCPAPAGSQEAVAQLLTLVVRPPVQKTIWGWLATQRDLNRAANNTDVSRCQR